LAESAADSLEQGVDRTIYGIGHGEKEPGESKYIDEGHGAPSSSSRSSRSQEPTSKMRQRQKPEATSRSRKDASRTRPDTRSTRSAIGVLLRFRAYQEDRIISIFLPFGDYNVQSRTDHRPVATFKAEIVAGIEYQKVHREAPFS